MAINATPKSAEANSYISIAEADAYMAETLHGADWAAASSANKEKALLFATRVIDSFSFHGFKFRGKQKLKLPTVGYTRQATGRIEQVISQTKFIVSNLNDRNNYSDTYWLYGGFEMTSGEAQYRDKLVTGYNIETVEITIESAFLVGTVAVGDQFTITQEIPEPVKQATVELGLVLVQSKDPLNFDPRVTQYSVGDVSETFGITKDGQYVLPPRVMTLLAPYVKTTEHGIG